MTPDRLRDAHLDALAWLIANYRGDQEGRDALAMNVDPVDLVDALTFTLLNTYEARFGDNTLAVLEQTRDEYQKFYDGKQP